MAHKNHAYLCFDGDEDIHYYYLMKAWHENEKFDFEFENAHDLMQSRDSSLEETIKRSLRERMKHSDKMVVLIGEKTKNLYKFVRWEIETALDLGLPIICVNLNRKKEMDPERCPPILQDKLAIHIPFGVKIVNYALQNWPASYAHHKSQGHAGAYFYKEHVYQQLAA